MYAYTSFTCLGIASQQTPKTAHFLGVRKYMGPGQSDNGPDIEVFCMYVMSL